MNKIVSKRFFSENVAEFVIEAPLIARSRRAGHFVIVRTDKHGERMPLTIADAVICRANAKSESLFSSRSTLPFLKARKSCGKT